MKLSLLQKNQFSGTSNSLINCFDSLNELIFLCSKSFEIIYINSSFSQKFIKGTNTQEEIKLFYHTNFLEEVIKALGTGAVINNKKLLFQDGEGNPFWGKLSAHLIENEYYFLSIDDIDHEVNLRLNYSQSIQQSPYAIIQTDESLRIKEVNNAAEIIFTTYKEEFKKMTFLDLMDNLAQVKLIERINSPTDLSSNQTLRELVFIKSNDHTFYGDLHILKLNSSGRVQYTFFVNDVTVISKQKEILSRKNQELVRINAQLDSFLYSVYHDLRGPITSVKGLINLFEVNTMNKQNKEYVHYISKSITKLNHVLDNIVTLSQNAKSRIVHEQVSGKEFFAQLEEDFSKLFDVYNIHFSYSFLSKEALFYTDTQRLYSIVKQLIQNAIDFRDVRKPQRIINMQLEANRQDFTIHIQDNGIGIDNSIHGRIFDLFYRGSEQSIGSGLGLYLVKETVDKMRGDINLQSEIGSGSIFSIRLPNDVKGQLISSKRKLRSAS